MSLLAPLQAAVQGYYRFPSIAGQQIVFSSEGDLWKVPATGGLAVRLTSHPAGEQFAHFSPDGQSIAFTADYEGNSDIYVMSSDGGEPKRLTFHPSREECVGWTPDGKFVLFRARRSGLDSQITLYQVPATGGEPAVVKVGVAASASFAAVGNMIAFNPFIWNGTWKRYRGGTAPKIWVGDLKAGKFWKMTTDDAVDQNPLWIGDRVYFLSEKTFPVNIWSCKPDGTDAKQVTSHTDYDVRSADTDGKTIVYTVAADLWTLDLSTGKSQRLDVTLPSDRIRERAHAEDASKTFESFDLSNDGKRVVICSRGEIWNAPAKPGGRIIQITDNDSQIRQRQPVFSPDGTKIACVTDETGEQEIAIYDASGKQPHKVITKNGKGWVFGPVWAPDSKHIAFSDLTGTLYVLDPDSGELKTVDQDRNQEVNEYVFSPDGKWLAYCKLAENRVQTIWVYEVATGKSTQVSPGFTNDHAPSWDPQGKYLFYLSNRVFRPELDDLDMSFLVTRSAKPCAIILLKDGKSPFLAEELLEDPKDKEKDKSAATKPSTQEKKELPVVKVDLDGIQQRQVEFPVERDNCSSLGAVEGKILWIVRPTDAMGDDDNQPPATPRQPRGKMMAYDFKKRKAEVYIEGIDGYALSGDTKKMAWRKDKEILVADTASKPGNEIEEKIAINSLPLMVNPNDEWKQIFAEAWRLQRDFYWAENMVGVDWPAMRSKYDCLLGRVATRGELNDVIGQLIGELGTSHTYIFGGDSTFQPPNPVPVGVLGADIEVEAKTGLHQFVRVLRAEPWETEIISPLTMSHANVKAGDYLLGVNGRELKRDDNADSRFVNLADVQVLLTVCSKPDKSDARDIQVQTLRDDTELRYADWCRRNREYVDQATSGRVGYFHLPDMGANGLIKFIEGFYAQCNKDALIIDDRSNHGGFVSQMLIEKLDRKLWAFMQPRRGMTSTYPERIHLGHKCVLINEHAGSDGDIFPDSFRTHGLGPLIGKRTWGGVIGIRMDKRFVDAGISSQPEYAWWDPKRGWSIENHGVDPDIEVEYRPEDYLAGRDPQLERGIAEMTKALQEKPVVRLQPPPLPMRAPKQ
jgi:tricorn protease